MTNRFKRHEDSNGEFSPPWFLRGFSQKRLRKNATAAILLALQAFSVQGRQYGDWTTEFKTPGMQFATTLGDGGAITGIACITNTRVCTAFVSTGVACAVGTKVPLILNSAIGAFPITAECVRTGSQEVLVASEFNQMLRAYESGAEIGFAMPLESGRFRVFRFSTAGAVAAVKEAQTFSAESR